MRHELESEEEIMPVKKGYRPLTPESIAAWVRLDMSLKEETDNPLEANIFGLYLLGEIAEQLSGIRIAIERLGDQ